MVFKTGLRASCMPGSILCSRDGNTSVLSDFLVSGGVKCSHECDFTPQTQRHIMRRTTLLNQDAQVPTLCQAWANLNQLMIVPTMNDV